MFGQLIASIMSNRETKGMLKFFRVNPWALSRFKEFLSKLYKRSTTGGAPREFFMSEMQVRNPGASWGTAP